MGTAHTACAAFLLLINVCRRAADNCGNNSYYNDIGHNVNTPSAVSYLLFTVLFFLIRPIMIAAIAATAISPGTNPAPNVPVVIIVPI